MTSTQKSRGFTLLEIMIVLAIVAGMVTLAMPYIGNRNAQIKRSLRELTVMSREIHSRSKLQGVAYRLVIDMGNPLASGDSPSEQSFWVEKSNGKVVIKEDEEEEALKREEETDEAKKADPKGFSIEGAIAKRTLPSGLRFEKVELTRLRSPIERGKAFIHYLPEGLADEAAIHIKGPNKMEYTVSIHPLTGRAELIAKALTLREMREQ